MRLSLALRLCAVLAVCILVLAFALVTVSSRTSHGASSAAEPIAPFVDQTFVRKVDLPANDLVVDPNTQTLYASIPSSVVNAGNSIVPINPTTGSIGTAVPIGSEPNQMAISDNGQYIYVVLDGAAAVRRFDIASQTPGIQFAFGNDSLFGPFRPRDLAVQPGAPGTVAIYRSAPSNIGAGVVIFDDATQRPGVAAVPSGTLTFNPTDPSRLYGLSVQDLKRFSVGSGGVSTVSTTNVVSSGVGKLSGGRLYSSNGRVFDPETAQLLGTFTPLASNLTNAFVVDSVVNRAYFITFPTTLTSATLHVFDTQTFQPIATVELTNVIGIPTDLVRWGSNGLAFSTKAGVYIIQTTLIPSPDPVPTPTPSPTGTPTPTPTPPVETAFVQPVSLTTSDIIYDPTSQKIYASVPSSAGPGGNSVVSIDPSNGSVGTSIFVGSEPNKLAVSTDGQYLYAALDGAGSVRRVDLATQTATLQFSLGFAPSASNGPLFAEDIEAVPGQPTAVAISRRNRCCDPRHEGVAIYDNGIPRKNVTASHLGSNSLEFSASSAKLYGFAGEDGQDTFRTMSVDSLGVTITREKSGLGGAGDFDNGRLYSPAGVVIDADTYTLVGKFPLTEALILAADSSVGRTFFITGANFSDSSVNANVVIQAFDQNTFLPVGSLTVGGVNGRVTRLLRWGTNGLAFSTSGGQVFLLRSNLVAVTNPAPTPTPTPTPSPTPTPTPVPTPGPGELREVNLTTNDLVIDPVTQTIFASVPSSVSPSGNSLTPIDPVTGVTGTPVTVGSEPGKLAISDDGSSIYVSLDGANAVRRFDVVSRTPGLQFSLGNDMFGGPTRVEDLAVAPGQPNTLAVARQRTNGTPKHAGVVVYDNGIPRTVMTPDLTGSNAIEFSRSPEILYGQNTESSEDGFRRMAVGPCGLFIFNKVEKLIFGDFRFDEGLVFARSGRVVDPETMTIRGTFALAPPLVSVNPQAIAPEVKARRVYFIVSEGGSTFLRVYDSKTFLRLGELRLPSITDSVTSLVRWGGNGLAFRTASRVYLLQNALIGVPDPDFTPAPIPASPTTTAQVRVTSSNGDPSGVSLNVTGTANTIGTTDSFGNFNVSGLPACSSITVTPTKANYVFSPTSQTLTNPTFASTISFTATLNAIGFQSSSSNAFESNGRIVIGVSRPVSTGPATASFETVSGTASDRSDFNQSLGTIQFAANESFKTITILLTNDSFMEGTEQFTVRLKDAVGAELHPPTSTITINIIDNDSQQDAPNPLSNAQFFVRQHYQDFLNRYAPDDPAGFNFWTNELTSCNSEPDPTKRGECFAVKHINVSAAFFVSIEFQQTGYLVHRFYTASYPAGASRPHGLPRLSEFLTDTQTIGRGVVVGAAGWEQALEQNKQAFALSWVERSEFLSEHPNTQTAAEYVDSLFHNNGVTPTSAERTAALAAFGSGDKAGRAAALRSVAQSQSVFNRQYNSAFVLMQYFGYLRRNPDDAPDGNFDGYQFWLDKLNQFGNFVDAEMVKAFLASSEYQHRFAEGNFDIRQ